ncbi:hypothetical protein Acr_07g0017150 [Actinidia rufa]|uniref:Uncharacterized protein n=1 Tax=Actinidia rufa TaxID=165716 RepID=A0A7J0F017_9ERIC|nr:hypothetical protein Acr_07g0017150 [Actinidia rufa]
MLNQPMAKSLCWCTCPLSIKAKCSGLLVAGCWLCCAEQ